MGGNNFKLTDQKDWGISSLSAGGGNGGGVRGGRSYPPFVICE